MESGFGGIQDASSIEMTAHRRDDARVVDMGSQPAGGIRRRPTAGLHRAQGARYDDAIWSGSEPSMWIRHGSRAGSANEDEIFYERSSSSCLHRNSIRRCLHRIGRPSP